MDFMQSLFQTFPPSSPPSPPVELCNDILFEIFLRLPPEVLPRLSILNKQSNEMIKSPVSNNLLGTKTKTPSPLCYGVLPT